MQDGLVLNVIAKGVLEGVAEELDADNEDTPDGFITYACHWAICSCVWPLLMMGMTTLFIR